MPTERLMIAERQSLLRWAAVCVPAVELLGLLSARIGGRPNLNPWYEALQKPLLQPPPAAFGIVWTILYAMLGLALAYVLAAKNARWRGWALGAFAVQFALNLAWSPIFFRAQDISLALGVIAALWVTALATAVLFGRVRGVAGWLLVPYLAWLTLASGLNWKINELNPEGGAEIEIGAEVAVPEQ